MINAALKGDQLTRQIENKPNGYMALATRAAEFEREGRYITALDLWTMARIHRFGKREA